MKQYPERGEDEIQRRGWYLYIASCSDQTFYTGITTNLARRIEQHNRGCGATYTSSRKPVILVAAWSFTSRSEALHAEVKMKQLSHQRKAEYVSDKAKDFEGGIRVGVDFLDAPPLE